MYTIDIDIGGTFTDGFFTDGKVAHTTKVPTTGYDLPECVLGCLELGAEKWAIPLRRLLQNTDVFRLSTTLATNTILQKSGSNIGLIVSKGYENSLYSTESKISPAVGLLVQPEMVVGVNGEIAPDGSEQEPLDEDQCIEAVRYLVQQGARLIGISLRDAWRNSVHEIQLRRLVQDRYPAHYLRSIPLQLGTEISSSIDDHARTNTLAANAYLHRELARGLYRIEDHIRQAGYQRPLLIVHASGGTARVAKTVAVQTLHSGPAVAVHGAWVLANWMEMPDVVTADMGGTSCDVGYVTKESPVWNPMPTVEGLPLGLPMVEVDSIAAGGGSIAKINTAGEIEVGPESAGADPGPACYGKGGLKPTVTDADLLLGYIDPEHFIGGRMKLDVDLANKAISSLSESVKRNNQLTAWQIRQVITQKMGLQIADGLKEKGTNPSSVTLFSVGGAGPPHACAVAESAGINRVVTFPFGSALSAFGSSSADVKHSYGQTIALQLADSSLPEIVNLAIDNLSKRGVRDMRGEGFEASTVAFDVNYLIAGDGRKSMISITEQNLADSSSVAALANQFSNGSASPSANLNLESVWLTCQAPVYHWRPEKEEGAAGSSQAAPIGSRAVIWGSDLKAVQTPIYDRDKLLPGSQIQGPAIIEAPDTTYIVPEAWTLTINDLRFLVMERDQNA